jgi:ribose transport system substrate-binding protein
MKWKKSVLGVLALGASAGLMLTGCSGGASSGGSSAGAGSDGYKIAFIQGVAGDEFYISMQCGIESAAKDAGATVTTQGPEKFDPTLQKPLVDSVVASKPDAILVAPTDVKAMEAPLKAAADAGIKVVLVDTTVDDPSFAVSQISSDNKGGGAAAFDAIKEAHPEGGKVLVVSVDPGISTTDARAEGFQEAVKGDDKFTDLGVQYSHNEPSTAAEIVTGVKQAGKEDSVTIVGFDAGPAQVKQLKEGTVQALVAQEPATIGKDGVAQAIAALNGDKVEAKIETGFTIITKDNVDGDAKDAVYQSKCG